MRTAQELIDAGCGVCGEHLPDDLEVVFPVAVSYALAPDAGPARWSKVRLVFACTACAAELQAQHEAQGASGTYSSSDG